MLTRISVWLFNFLLRRLRNGKEMAFSREEIRCLFPYFSQFGEDIAVLRYFRDAGPGFYVDVGAYHPLEGSNTLLLHKLGWSGINIDMNPEKIAVFQQYRPNDFNVCAAISDQVAAYETVHGGTTIEAVVWKTPVPGEKLDNQGPVTRTLADVVRESPWAKRRIDYLNIDCEGHDLAVLRSLPLAEHAPRLIMIEALTSEAIGEIRDYLEERNYLFVEKVGLTLLFTLPDVPWQPAAIPR